MTSADLELSKSYLECLKYDKSLIEIVNNLQNIYDSDIKTEQNMDQLSNILSMYQEQPRMLDSFLSDLIAPLLKIIQDLNTDEKLLHLVFKVFYQITKTRGFKHIIRLLPHEVEDLEPVFLLLSKQDINDTKTWETRYILLLWMSILCMIPFDLDRYDGSEISKSTLINRIINIGKDYLTVSDKGRDAAAYMLAHFFTRHDVVKTKLNQFIDWCIEKLTEYDSNSMNSSQAILGILPALSSLCKLGKREDLFIVAPRILNVVINLQFENHSQSTIRKLSTKLIQRIGLVFLPVRIATWRYQRGLRSLTDNLKLQINTDIDNFENIKKINCDKIDDDVPIENDSIPNEIETVIEFLLNALRDRETIVRWSAAKGIGRITMRLTKSMADDVVESVLTYFSPTETDSSWHGSCLAIAELSRRGLLLPERFPSVLPHLMTALTYDIKKGTYSVGSHVRDAACFIAWAFARAYKPEEIEKYVHDLANQLVIVSVFDREVNVRRAASAAFQEHVGRQGHFPHGIEIITVCDYFAVGNRTKAYLELAPFIAQWNDYSIAIIEHILEDKLQHWDITIRELSATCLKKLVEKESAFILQKVVPTLLNNCTHVDINIRHGAIIGLGNTVLGISEYNGLKNENLENLLQKDDVIKMKNLPSILKNSELYKGFGGEIMRRGVCQYICCLSKAKLPLSDDIQSDWQLFLDECATNQGNEDIRNEAVITLSSFFEQYFITNNEVCSGKFLNVFENYIENIQNTRIETTRQGFSLALGSLPKLLIHGYFDKIVNIFVSLISLKTYDAIWAEARRDTINALLKICIKCGCKKDGNSSKEICDSNVENIYNGLFIGMNDYVLNNKGDVGSYVRESSMQALKEITSLLCINEPTLLNPYIIERFFKCIIQQNCEKIDRTRSLAGEIFISMLYHNPPIPYVPQRNKLIELFNKDKFSKVEFNWSIPSETFPQFTQLLSTNEYRYNIILGLCVSVGGLTESLVLASSTWLLNYMMSINDNEDEILKICNTLIDVFQDYKKTDRIILPLIKTLSNMFSNGCFDALNENNKLTFAEKIFTLLKLEIYNIGELSKLINSLDLFSALLEFISEFNNDLKKSCLSQMCIFLGHKFPLIRKTTGIKLYESLLIVSDVYPMENTEKLFHILSDTQWDKPLEEVRPIRNEICNLLSIPTPRLKTTRDKRE